MNFYFRISCLLLSLAFAIPAFAGRSVITAAFETPVKNSYRVAPEETRTHVHGYETRIYLTNISNKTQTGTVEIQPGAVASYVNFIYQSSPTSYTKEAGSYVSYMCGSTEESLTGSGHTPLFPSAQSFSLGPKQSRSFIVGVLFYRTVNANDDFTHTNGGYSPSFEIKINEDTGAMIGYHLSIGRCFSHSGWDLCAGSSNVPSNLPFSCEKAFSYSPSPPREINGGRPF